MCAFMSTYFIRELRKKEKWSEINDKCALYACIGLYTVYGWRNATVIYNSQKKKKNDSHVFCHLLRIT